MAPSTQGPAPTSFLRLPRELRDLIILHLLQERRVVPETPADAGERIPTLSSPPCTIYYEPCSPKPTLLQLKLCNRQLYAEVCEAITKHVKCCDSGPAHLDIMVEGSRIWPTWRSLPVTAHLDPVVDVTLRLFEATTDWGSEFATGAARQLWTLFRQLVFQGPCLVHGRALKTPLDIARLRFEIVLSFPASVDDLFGTYRDVFDRLQRLAFDNVGLGHVDTIEACLGADRRVWKLKQLPTGLTWASRI